MAEEEVLWINHDLQKVNKTGQLSREDLCR